MAYYIDLFSPETYEAFSNSDRSISGFRERQAKAAGRLKKGDKLICYMTKLSRWIGVLEVIKGPFEDSTPIFYKEEDPFVIRFKVNPLIWLSLDKTIPIHDSEVWDNLSFTKDLDVNSTVWTGKVRGSLVKLDDSDGVFLESILKRQSIGGNLYKVDQEVYKKFLLHRMQGEKKNIAVAVPSDNEEECSKNIDEQADVRESIKIQALLTDIGSKMGMKIWIPKSDRGRVLAEVKNNEVEFLEKLPLNYDEITLKTIEQIDVLWLKGRSIKRAFEVEHTTSIYSGILRMADLLALQPNMDIKLHIVAPINRREKVFQEILRPVFSLLARGPLSEACTYLSYDSIRELKGLRHLGHLSDDVLEEYGEGAED